jgi:hypothetical protein
MSSLCMMSLSAVIRFRSVGLLFDLPLMVMVRPVVLCEKRAYSCSIGAVPL